LQEVITRLGIDFDILSYTVDEFENDIDYITSRKVRKKVKELMGLEIFIERLIRKDNQLAGIFQVPLAPLLSF